MDDLGTVFSFLSLNLKTVTQIRNFSAISHKTFESINYSKEHKLRSLYKATSFLPVYFNCLMYSPSHLFLILMLKLKDISNIDELC